MKLATLLEKERTSIGFDINPVILTRDTWMHRLDIARSTGRPFEVSANHDGRLLSAPVASDWRRCVARPTALLGRRA